MVRWFNGAFLALRSSIPCGCIVAATPRAARLLLGTPRPQSLTTLKKFTLGSVSF